MKTTSFLNLNPSGHKKEVNPMVFQKFKIAQLPSTFMLTSIIGFLVSVIWVGKYDTSYGFAFGLVFGIMFIASLVSMTYAPVGDELQIDMGRVKAGKDRRNRAAKR